MGSLLYSFFHIFSIIFQETLEKSRENLYNGMVSMDLGFVKEIYNYQDKSYKSTWNLIFEI